MSDLIERNEKTADGLRDRLFQALDLVIRDEISIENVESLCALSDKIIDSAKTEIMIHERNQELDLKKRQAIDSTARLISSSFNTKIIGDNRELHS